MNQSTRQLGYFHLSTIKHGASFYEAQFAFLDEYRVIAEDVRRLTLSERLESQLKTASLY